MGRSYSRKFARGVYGVGSGLAYGAYSHMKKTAPVTKKRNMGRASTRAGLVESTTNNVDMNNISIKKNGKRARYARKKMRFARRLQKTLTRLRPTRTYGVTHAYVGQVQDANLSGLVTNRDGITQNTVGSVGMQSVTVIPIATFSKTDTKPNNDLNNLHEIGELDLTADQKQKLKYKLLVKSVFFELMLRNVDSAVPCYVDVYFWKCKRDSDYDIADLVPASDAQVGQDGPMVTDLRNYYTDTYGWTPYQNRTIMSYINIFKKVRYYLQPGQTAQLEMRLRTNKIYMKEQNDVGLDSVQQKLKKGLSCGVICIAYGAPQPPSDNSGNNTITGRHQVRYAVNKNLFWQNLTPHGDPAEEEDRAIIGRL